MAEFEFSKFDGSQEFTPQSADRLFDEFSKHMLDYGSQMMDYLHEWEDEHPDVVELLLKHGYVEQDVDGRYVVTPKGLRRVENRVLEELFDVSRMGKFGKHDTAFRGSGQTVHEESKPYEFGDPVSNLNMHETLKNALHR
ncbi:MAG: VWA domain-containing protein, partial [Planctomycetaceae bacterium]